jgi:hypothetical protein
MFSCKNGSAWDFLGYLILFFSFLARLLVHNYLLFYSYGPLLIDRLPLYRSHILFTKCI